MKTDLPRSLEATGDRLTLMGMQSVVGFDLEGKVLGQYAATQENGTLEREVAGELGRAYGRVSQAAAGASSSYAAIARQRFQASVEVRDFQFMMVQADRGFGIAQVDKASGTVRGLISIGHNKRPAYEVDDVARRVYYSPDDRLILGYVF
jgi:hypothetical protein